MIQPEEVYLIWSNEHRAWWGPGRMGYAGQISYAGHYTRKEAIEICQAALMTALHVGVLSEIPVRLEDIGEALDQAPAAVIKRFI